MKEDYFKGRILPSIPLKQDFEAYELNQDTSKPPPPAVPNTLEPPTPFAYPPLPWNAARFKFEIREKDGNKALVKTIDNKRLQRGVVFINRPDLKNYTIEADLLTEGNKRKMSELGLINQRYLINLKGNAQVLEVTSNQELFKQSVPFKISPNRPVSSENTGRRGGRRQRHHPRQGVEERRPGARRVDDRSAAQACK